MSGKFKIVLLLVLVGPARYWTGPVLTMAVS